MTDCIDMLKNSTRNSPNHQSATPVTEITEFGEKSVCTPAVLEIDRVRLPFRPHYVAWLR